MPLLIYHNIYLSTTVDIPNPSCIEMSRNVVPYMDIIPQFVMAIFNGPKSCSYSPSVIIDQNAYVI